MSGALGFVTAGLQYGLDTILIKPKRQIGPLVAQVTIEEVHDDETEITEHPVEMGAIIADHAFIRPAELTIKMAWSDSPTVAGLFQGIASGIGGTVAGIQSLLNGTDASQSRDFYNKLLALRATRVPFDVYTGKRYYQNMLIRALSVTNDKETEHCLIVTARFKQVIIVQTQVVVITAAAQNQSNPQATNPITNAGTKQLAPSTRYRPTGISSPNAPAGSL